MKASSVTYINEAVTLYHTDSPVRRDLLKSLFVNSIDGMRFYEFLAKQSRLPVIGKTIKNILNLYYRYIHTNSVKLPLRDIEDVIQSAKDIYVGPCSCRLIFEEHDCDAPLFTCMRINTFAQGESEWEKDEVKKRSRKLSKKEAVEIMRNARKHGLVLSLESCIQPYQNNICACCSCCCLEMKFRYEYEIDVCFSGPYIPVVNGYDCKKCNSCIDSCPVGAISRTENSLSIDSSRCLGCGLCAEFCPKNNIIMKISYDRIRKNTEPGKLRTVCILSFLYLCMLPMYVVYRLLSKNQQYKYDEAKPRASDYDKVRFS